MRYFLAGVLASALVGEMAASEQLADEPLAAARRLQARLPHGLHGLNTTGAGAASIGACIVDAGAGAFYLAQSLVIASALEDDCNGPEESVPCTADVFGVIQSVVNTAAYFTVLAAVCSPHAKKRVQCAADSEFVIGTVSEAAQASVSMRNTCGKIDGPRVVPPPPPIMMPFEGGEEYGEKDVPTRASSEAPAGGGSTSSRVFLANSSRGSAQYASRRLGGGHSHEREIGRDIAWCIVGHGSAVVYFSMAGLGLANAITGCSGPGNARELVADCTADIFQIISALGDVVSYIATSISTCTLKTNLDALCLSDAGSMVNALGGLASAIASLTTSCEFNTTTKVHAEPAEAIFGLAAETPRSELGLRRSGLLGLAALAAAGALGLARAWYSGGRLSCCCGHMSARLVMLQAPGYSHLSSAKPEYLR